MPWKYGCIGFIFQPQQFPLIAFHVEKTLKTKVTRRCASFIIKSVGKLTIGLTTVYHMEVLNHMQIPNNDKQQILQWQK